MEFLSPTQPGRRARREGRAPGRGADHGRHRRDGGAELRPAPAGRAARPDPGPRAGHLGAGRRRDPARRRRHLHPADRGAGRRAARPRPGLAHGRLPADPQPRHGRRQPRRRLARRRHPPGAARRLRGGRARLGRRRTPGAGPRVLHRRQAARRATGRADHRGLGPPGHRSPAVQQDRHPQRDGDRGRRVRPRPAPGHPAGRRRHRLGRADPAPGDRRGGVPRRRAGLGGPRPARPIGGRGVRPPGGVRGVADRRRPRHRGVPAARPGGDGRAAASPGPGPSTGGETTDAGHADRQRRTPAGRRRLGGREPALRPARADGAARVEERLRAGRVRLVHRLPRRGDLLRVPGRGRPGRRPRGDHGRGPRRRRGPAPGAAGVPGRRRGAVRLLHPGPAGRHPRPARPRPATPTTPRSARRWPATCAAAPATRRSSTPSTWPRSGYAAERLHEPHRDRRLRGRHDGRRPDRARRRARGRGRRPDHRASARARRPATSTTRRTSTGAAAWPPRAW